MKGKIHSPEKVLKLISLSNQMLDERKSVTELARHSKLKQATWYRYKDTYGMKGPEMRKLKELQAKNHPLKTIVADLKLDNDILKELA
jgi:hypothetical protein